MNNAETFAALVAANPADKITASVAVDYLHEHENQSRWQALRNVARWRKDARDAKEMAEAAALLAVGSPWKRPIEALIHAAGSEEWRMFGTVIVVPGSRYPKRCRVAQNAHPLQYWRLSITVGARRVLMMRDAIREEWDQSVPFDVFVNEYTATI